MSDAPTFRYPIYTPDSSCPNVIEDWGIGESKTTTDINSALAQPFSIAAVRVLFNSPDVFNYDPALSRVDLSEFDLVILSDIEYSQINEIKEWAEKNQIFNYVLALGGLCHTEQIDSSCMVYRPWWVYNHVLRLNEYQDTHLEQKPFLFEALLGARRPHRDYVMMALDKTGLLDCSLVTYRDCFIGGIIDKTSQAFQERFYDTPLQWPYVSPNINPDWEVSDKITNGNVSLIVPYEIYRRTHYSIICETHGTGNVFFLAEKIAKCLFAGRIFVLFGPPNFLSKLNELGFQTWSSLIDESYDAELRDEIRFEKAMQQVMRLAWFENPKNMLWRIEAILQHNRDRFSSMQLQYKYEMYNLLHSHIPDEHWLC